MGKEKKIKGLTKKESKICQPFIEKMNDYKKMGVSITLGGEDKPLETIAALCIVKEQGSYMGDCIFDEEGNWVELRFDKVFED